MSMYYEICQPYSLKEERKSGVYSVRKYTAFFILTVLKMYKRRNFKQIQNKTVPIFGKYL